MSSTAPPCWKSGATSGSSWPSAGSSRRSASRRSPVLSACCSSPRAAAHDGRHGAAPLARAAWVGAAGRRALDRVRGDRRRLDGALQGRADALGPRRDAGPARGSRPRRRPRRGRANPRRGAREVRRRAEALPHARRRHGIGDHRDHDGRGHGDPGRGRPPGDHRPSHDGRGGLSCRLPRMECPDSRVRPGASKDDRRVAPLDPVRPPPPPGAVGGHPADRPAHDTTMTHLIGRVGATRPCLRPPSVLTVLTALATTILATTILTALATTTLVTTILMALATTITPAAAHHVGAYVPKDNAVTTNFKQVKFSVQARKFDVALRLFETGALRAEMRPHAATLPAGLEDGTRAALAAGDGPEVERRLMIFFAALSRDLALEADRRIARADATADTRVATGRKFLEAIWRYYNLVDFAVASRDNKASVALRLAFDEAETYAKPATGRTAPADPTGLRKPPHRIAQVLSTLIESSSTPSSSTPPRRNS